MLLTYKDLYSLAHTYLKDHQLAEDAVSDGYMKVIEKINTINTEQNLNGYLRTLVINRSLDIMRKRKREINVEERVVSIKPANPLTSVDTKNVRIVLSELPQVEREVLLLWQYGFTIKEVSEKTNYTINQVRLLLEKAKKKFFEKYHKLKGV